MRKSEINAEFAKIMQKWRRKGGRNSVKTRLGGKTPEEISAMMREVNRARWNKSPAESATSETAA
jgi:hypothetical protein